MVVQYSVYVSDVTVASPPPHRLGVSGRGSPSHQGWVWRRRRRRWRDGGMGPWRRAVAVVTTYVAAVGAGGLPVGTRLRGDAPCL